MDKKIIFFIGAMFIFCSFSALAVTPSDQKGPGRPSEGGVASRMIHPQQPRPVLTIMPREVDLGFIKPGSTAFGEFKLSDITPGTMECAASCPDGWEITSGKALPVKVSHEPVSLRVELMIAEPLEKARTGKSAHPAYAARMRMQSEGNELICQKSLKAGQHRKAIALTFAGGPMNIFVDFRIQPDQASPSISLNPQRLDLGSQPPGKILSKKIELTNKGREKLQWSIIDSRDAGKSLHPAEPKQERYFSFCQEELPEPGKYLIPEHLKDAMELIGKWTEKNGYPLSSGGAGSIKYRFQGTGISIFLKSHTPEGDCSVYLDETLVDLPEEMSGE